MLLTAGQPAARGLDGHESARPSCLSSPTSLYANLHGQLFGRSQYVAFLQLDQFQVQTVVSLFQFTEFVTGLAQPFRNHRNHTVCQHVAPPGYEITAAV